MKIYLIVFLLQVLFNIFKVLEIKLTYENKVNKLLLNSIFLNIVSLGSIYYSIGELLAGDLIIVFFYLAGSVVGKWIAMNNYNILRKSNKKGDSF